MTKYKNLKDYEEMMNMFFDEEENVFIMEDLKEFVKNDDFVIFDLIEEDLDECNVIFVRGKYYMMVERFEGMRFVEVEKENVKVYWKKNVDF